VVVMGAAGICSLTALKATKQRELTLCLRRSFNGSDGGLSSECRFLKMAVNLKPDEMQ
jgi:hypothetical protein